MSHFGLKKIISNLIEIICSIKFEIIFLSPKRDMVEFNFPGPIVASRNNDVGIIGIFMHSVSWRHR